jgi:hypothetical protein
VAAQRAEFVGRNALHGQHHGNLAAVVGIVGEDSPERPLARNRVDMPAVAVTIRLE